MILALLGGAVVAGVWGWRVVRESRRPSDSLQDYAGRARHKARELADKAPKIPGEIKENLADLVPGGSVAETLDSASDRAGVLETPILIARVTRVVEGDRLEVESGGERKQVELRCVNTGGPGTSSATRKRALALAQQALEGRQVRLEFEPGDREAVRQTPLRAYVLLGDRNFNVDLVQEGLSRYITDEDASQRYDRQMFQAESAARAARRGLWADSELAGQ